MTARKQLSDTWTGWKANGSAGTELVEESIEIKVDGNIGGIDTSPNHPLRVNQ